jgi:hypothetical protein
LFGDPAAVVPQAPEGGRGAALLDLHGLWTGDLVPALEGFVGSAAGLSAAVVTRLVAAWQADAEAFSQRDLADRMRRGRVGRRVHFRVGWSRPAGAAW